MTETSSARKSLIDPEALVVRIENLTHSVREAIQTKNARSFTDSLQSLRSEVQTYSNWRKHKGLEPENGDERVEACQKSAIHSIRFQSAS